MPTTKVICSAEDTLWLAGLLEGEGCFHDQLSRGHRYARITLQMADRDVVERAAALMGGNSVGTIVNKRRANVKNQYRVFATGSTACAVMRIVLPHMGERRTAKIHQLLEEFG